jgi:NADH-quinone oxidoreductase subunit M
VFFGPVEVAENRSLIDLGLREKLVMVALIAPIIWIGVYPNPLLRRIEPSVIELLRVVDVRRSPPSAPQPGESEEARVAQPAVATWSRLHP